MTMKSIKAFMGKSNLFLTENTVLRYLNFSALYIAQGIPEGITFFAIIVYFFQTRLKLKW